MSDERIELAPWIVDMAQRVVDNHSGEWLTPTWIVAQEALGSVDGWPNDGHSEFVALLIDELVETRQRLAAAEAENKRLRMQNMDLLEIALEQALVYRDDNDQLRFTDSGDLVGKEG